jgi:hypothetical protein
MDQAVQASEGLSTKAWRFLNHSFTIWLLSSLVVPLTVWSHTQWVAAEAQRTARIEGQKKRNDRIEKLDSEIAFRFSQSLAQLAIANARSRQDRPDLIRRALANLTTRAPAEDTQTLFPEFADQGALSLMTELRSELIAGGEASETMSPSLDGTVSSAIKSLGKLSILDHGSQLPEELAKDLLRIVASTKLHSGVRRWNKEFLYTDCSTQRPFC